MRKEDADVARREMIGLDVVVESPSKALDGLAGRIVDETKHTFVVERSGSAREAVVPKSGNRFVLRVGDRRVVVPGDSIAYRPEDRTKKVRR